MVDTYPTLHSPLDRACWSSLSEMTPLLSLSTLLQQHSGSSNFLLTMSHEGGSTWDPPTRRGPRGPSSGPTAAASRLPGAGSSGVLRREQ